MGKALVVFDPSHRETRRVAEEIAVGLSRAGRVVTVVTSWSELSAKKVETSGIVVLGSPASAREASREAHDLAALLVAGGLDRKTVSVFDAGPNARHGVGAKALRQSLQETDPALRFASPGISVVVRGARHELPEEEVVRCRQFGEHLAGIALAAGSA
jgi:flavorubredoxin